MKKYKHISVLLNESIKNLKIKKNGIYIDATFGNGGHSKIILSKLGKNGKLLALDKDPEAINIARKINDNRFKILNINFSNLLQINLKKQINGILFDLGLSSLQLDNPKRGFSFINDGPLDMRMNQTKGKKASELIKYLNIQDLYFIFKKIGEEFLAKRIAIAIYKYNKIKSITRTKELSNLIKLNYYKIYNNKIHPATKCFMAIRIFVNNEIKEIKLGLKYGIKLLSTKGRLSIISFNSLEDKIIKNFINIKNYNKLKLINKIKPTLYETKKNYRSRSSVLRILEKI